MFLCFFYFECIMMSRLKSQNASFWLNFSFSSIGSIFLLQNHYFFFENSYGFHLYNTGTISLSSIFQTITLFFSTPCTLAICVKCFVLLFLFSKPALLFVLKNLHAFFLSLTSAFKMLFFLPTEILFVFFLSLTSMLKILFFFIS